MIASMLLATLLSLPFILFGTDVAGALIQPLLVTVGNSLMLIYALKVYPSYFTDKPVFKSNKIISCANFTFGSWVGALWNTNLTKKKKGVSYIITAVGSGLVVAQGLFGIIIAIVMLFGSM